MDRPHVLRIYAVLLAPALGALQRGIAVRRCSASQAKQPRPRTAWPGRDPLSGGDRRGGGTLRVLHAAASCCECRACGEVTRALLVGVIESAALGARQAQPSRPGAAGKAMVVALLRNWLPPIPRLSTTFMRSAISAPYISQPILFATPCNRRQPRDNSLPLGPAGIRNNGNCSDGPPDRAVSPAHGGG
jgi:hypothetical protein